MYSCNQYFQDKISIHILPSRNKENHTDSNLDNSTLSVHTKEVVKHLRSKEIGKYNQRDTHKRRNPIKKIKLKREKEYYSVMGRKEDNLKM